MQENNSEKKPTPLPDFWRRSISDLRGELDPQIFSAFIEPLRLSSFDEQSSEIVVTAPSKLVCNHVDRNLKGRIEKSLCAQLGVGDLQLRFSVESGIEGSPDRRGPEAPYIVVKKIRGSVEEKDRPAADGGQQHGINPKYTFGNFVVGSSNQFCHAAAMHVAESPGTDYNPFFIYSGVGLGKTHLLHAIGNAVLSRNPNAKVLYLSSETFTNDLIQSLRFAKMDEFKNRLRNIEVLLIDDIQFMIGKERTQEEFFHTFNALYNAKCQIVITSDKVPQEIPGIEERLKTRFSWGLTADLQCPDFETRVAILNRKATVDNFALPQDVAQFVAEKISSNVRELEGALTRLHALCSLQKLPLSLDLARRALEPLLKPKAVNISIDDIQKVVSAHFGIKVSEITSKRRTRNLSFPRHIAMFLCRKHTTCSYPEIGAAFGGRDHSSVIHAASVISTKVENDASLQAHMIELERLLLGN